MIKIADASINTFPISDKTDNAQPDEPIFVLSSSHLQNLQDALDLLQARLDALEIENKGLKSKLEALEKDQAWLSENQHIELRLINELRQNKESGTGETFRARAEKVDRYMSNRPDHRVTFVQIKGFLEINARLLNPTIKCLMSLFPGKYSITVDKSDKRRKWLFENPRI